jgi:hypothetical protein
MAPLRKVTRLRSGSDLICQSAGNLEREAAVGTGVESLRGGGERQEERCNREMAKELGGHGQFSVEKSLTLSNASNVQGMAHG